MSAIKKIVRPKPVVLITLEGWGIAPAHPGNAITESDPTYFNHLISHYPALSLTATGSVLGNNEGPSSEKGHLVIGLGRALTSLRVQIDNEINQGTFPAALGALSEQVGQRPLHIIGLISQVTSEAALNHLEAIIDWLKTTTHQEIFLHAILDGRDMSPKAGQKLLLEVEKKLAVAKGVVATVTGRLYALDLHQHESRLEKTVKVLRSGQGNQAVSTSEALKESYAKKIYDEEFPPTAIVNEQARPITTLTDQAVVLFLNFDSVAIRPLAQALLRSFSTPPPVFSLGDYQLGDQIQSLFTPPVLTSTLGEVIAGASLRQLRIADSEGFAAITGFLNGGIEKVLVGEERRLLSTPLMETYQAMPAFNNEAIAQAAVKTIEENKYDFIAINFANIDRVGQRGDLVATKAAVRAVDNALHKIVNAVLETSGVVLITGSHGLAEQMKEVSEGEFLAHSTNPVPFILAGKQFAGYSLGLPEAIGGDLSILSPAGSLLDIAPTILKLLRLPVPTEMTGQSFFDELRLV